MTGCDQLRVEVAPLFLSIRGVSGMPFENPGLIELLWC